MVVNDRKKNSKPAGLGPRDVANTQTTEEWRERFGTKRVSEILCVVTDHAKYGPHMHIGDDVFIVDPITGAWERPDPFDPFA